MKFVRKHINEGFFKSAEQIKQERSKKNKFSAEDVSKLAIKTLISSKKSVIDDLLCYFIIDGAPWYNSNSNLAKTCNLRPGDTEIKDFLYFDSIENKSKDEKENYIYNIANIKVYPEGSYLIIELPLQCSSFPVNEIEFKGNTLFTYIDNIEKMFEKYLNIPVKVKVILQSSRHAAGILRGTDKEHYITSIFINHQVDIKKFIKFLQRTNVSESSSPFIKNRFALVLSNFFTDKTFDKISEIGNYIKFDVVTLGVTSNMLSKIENGSKEFKLKDISGVKNLLKDSDSKVYLSKIYWSNPDIAASTGQEDISDPGMFITFEPKETDVFLQR